MEETGFSFDDFAVEMEDFEIKHIHKFDRMWKIGSGGSLIQKPLVFNGMVYFGSNDHNVYALDAKTGMLKWRFRTEGNIAISSPVQHEGTIYVGSYDHNLYALDAVTGELKWKFKTMGRIASSVCVNDGVVYFGSRDQNIYAVESKDGRLIWKFRTNECIGSTPVVHEGGVLIGSFDRFLYRLDAKTGRLLWRIETQGEIFNSNPLLVHENVVYFGSFDNHLYAVDVQNGKEVWRCRMGSYGISVAPVFHDGAIYQGTRDGTLIAVSMEGKIHWKFRAFNEPMGAPIFHENKIYAVCEDYNLYCLDMEGKKQWHFHTEEAVWWQASMSDSIIYFGSWDCNLYAVNVDTHKLVWKFRTAGSVCPRPPAFETFELMTKKTVKEEWIPDTGKSRYQTTFREEESAGFYKSRMTYQISTQYAAKGKYQVDSDEEAF